MTTKNLGQISAVYIGNIAPLNTRLIWYNDNVGIKKNYIYDDTLLQWVPLSGNNNGNGNAAWGTIGGAITNQTDLVTYIQNQIASSNGNIIGPNQRIPFFGSNGTLSNSPDLIYNYTSNIINTTSGSLSFGTLGFEVLKIHTNQNISIGTNTANGKLHIKGAVGAQNIFIVEDPLGNILFKISDINNIIIKAKLKVQYPNGDFAISNENTNGNNYLLLNQDGKKTSIGHNNEPTTILDVAPFNVNYASFRIRKGDDNITILNKNDGDFWYNSSGLWFRFNGVDENLLQPNQIDSGDNTTIAALTKTNSDSGYEIFNTEIKRWMCWDGSFWYIRDTAVPLTKIQADKLISDFSNKLSYTFEVLATNDSGLFIAGNFYTYKINSEGNYNWEQTK